MSTSSPDDYRGSTPWQPPKAGRLLDSVLGISQFSPVSPSVDAYVAESLAISVSSVSLDKLSASDSASDEDYDGFDDLCTAASVDPPESFDTLLRMAEYASSSPTVSPLPRPWVSRALSTHEFSAHGTKYKPVAKKVRPVPTYMPHPEAIVFKPIDVGELPPLPTSPKPLSEFVPTERITRERLQKMLSTIPAGFLWPAEIDLLVDVIVRREKAIAFCDNERGVLSRKIFPDYEIPVIEHTPWSIAPIRFPSAIAEDVRKLLKEQELAGKYEMGYSSYCSRIWAVAKKNRKLRLVLDLQDLNHYVIRDTSLPLHPHDFAERSTGHVIYGLANLFSGFDAATLAVVSHNLTM